MQPGAAETARSAAAPRTGSRHAEESSPCPGTCGTNGGHANTFPSPPNSASDGFHVAHARAARARRAALQGEPRDHQLPSAESGYAGYCFSPPAPRLIASPATRPDTRQPVALFQRRARRCAGPYAPPPARTRSPSFRFQIEASGYAALSPPRPARTRPPSFRFQIEASGYAALCGPPLVQGICALQPKCVPALLRAGHSSPTDPRSPGPAPRLFSRGLQPSPAAQRASVHGTEAPGSQLSIQPRSCRSDVAHDLARTGQPPAHPSLPDASSSRLRYPSELRSSPVPAERLRGKRKVPPQIHHPVQGSILHNRSLPSSCALSDHRRVPRRERTHRPRTRWRASAFPAPGHSWPAWPPAGAGSARQARCLHVPSRPCGPSHVGPRRDRPGVLQARPGTERTGPPPLGWSPENRPAPGLPALPNSLATPPGPSCVVLPPAADSLKNAGAIAMGCLATGVPDLRSRAPGWQGFRFRVVAALSARHAH